MLRVLDVEDKMRKLGERKLWARADEHLSRDVDAEKGAAERAAQPRTAPLPQKQMDSLMNYVRKLCK